MRLEQTSRMVGVSGVWPGSQVMPVRALLEEPQTWTPGWVLTPSVVMVAAAVAIEALVLEEMVGRGPGKRESGFEQAQSVLTPVLDQKK